MGQKKGEITDRTELDRIILKSLYCHLACSSANQPYIVPLSFGYDGDYIYFHTASEGKKSDIFAKNSNVCICFESDVSLVPNSAQACSWSFKFNSVLATGQIEEITSSEDRIMALNQIMAHYSRKEWTFPEKNLSNTRLWRVKLKALSGKKSTD